MESFYGGKQGFSFVIARPFKTEEEMIQNFRQGPNYTEVHFGEYVIIDTENKNSKENGRIYLRGYNYPDEKGGAIYKGCIVGPSGPAPMLELTTIKEVEEKEPEEGYDYRMKRGSYSVDPNNDIVPGKEENGKYNDSIEWASCCVRDDNGVETIAYIGFKFPYTVIDFEAEVTDSYNRTNLISRTDDKTHPFYEKWKVKIPKGIKGDSAKNFRSMVADTSVEYYTGRDFDIAHQRKIWVYDLYNYEASSGGTYKTFYAGDYINDVEEMMIDETDYNLLVYYSDPKIRQTFIDQGIARTKNSKTGWLPLGVIKEYSGILIGMNLSPNNIPGVQTPINYLNGRYPSGLTDPMLKGKIVTVGYDTGDKEFFAFDYSSGTTTSSGYKGWYLLGSLGEDGGSPQGSLLLAGRDDSNLEDSKNKLDTGGLWFILEE